MNRILPRKCVARRATLFRVGGFERSQLAVNDLRDLEKLDAVEFAGDRVTAVVVDPVEDADAILDRVSE
jgi:hypothetical protein